MIARTIHPRLYSIPGYTLVELVVALGTLSVLMLTLQSAALIASRSIPSPSSRPAATSAAARAADLIAADLTYAISMVRTAASEVEFVVPDRNGDGTAETILYSWSGTAGAPLTRYCNGVSPAVILDNCQHFELAYDTRIRQQPPADSESNEILLMRHDPSFGIFADQRITSSTWIGQYFKPDLPSDAASWRLTRALFRARVRGAQNGVTRVQIHTASAGLPSKLLEEVSLFENRLETWYTWQNIRFSNLSGLSPSNGLCLVMRWQSDVESCDIQYQSMSTTANGGYLVSTSSGGLSWIPQSLQDMPFYIFGTITKRDPVTYQHSLINVRYSLQANSDINSRLAATVRILNEPEVAAP